jgi:asparaginyl-tRNA synthetase
MDLSKLKITEIHVCEVQGHDTEGSGTEKMPYKTVLKAVQLLDGNADAVAKILVRKDMELGFVPIAKAAVKKGLKLYEQGVRKAQKEAERLVAEAAEREAAKAAEMIKLEEAKKIVLTEDASLPVAQKVGMNTLINRSK